MHGRRGSGVGVGGSTLRTTRESMLQRRSRAEADSLGEFRISFFNAKSGDKAVAALVSGGHVADGEPETIAAFLLANDGKLDASKVGDWKQHQPTNGRSKVVEG